MNIKKMTGILLALILVCAMTVSALAANGTITINTSSDGTSPAGRTFKAYSILNVTLAVDNTPVYTVPDSMKSFYASYFSLNFTGKTQAWIDNAVITRIAALSASQMESFAEAALIAAKAAGITPVTIDSSTGYANVSVPYGYYIIEDTSTGTEDHRVSAVMLDTTNPSAVISLKADTPNLDKVIVATTGDVDTTEAAIGDMVNYKITTKVPDMTGYTKYAFNVADTMGVGLTFDTASVVVKVNGVTLTANAVGSSTGYHVLTGAAAAPCTFKVIFHNFIQYKAQAGNSIVVTYSAMINSDATIGKTGNANHGKLIYSNDPTHEGEGGDIPTVYGETPEQITKTYVTGISLKKFNADKTQLLAGAVFTLEGTALNDVAVIGDVFTADMTGSYYKLKDNTYTTTVPTVDTADKYDSTTQLYKKETKISVTQDSSVVTITGTVSADGTLNFDGLKSGTYTLTEVVAPSGYNLLAAPISIVITCDLPLTISTGNEVCTWHVSSPSSVTEDGMIYLEVTNAKGTVLPSTGGIGTTIFTIAGLALMAGAALLLVMRRKVKKAAVR
ncbi:MAG: SpaH/EbpB family LPXTG-anchored major pilin [Eubacteriales bacterium]|nr:SpaH/EbpB family LPXTG-anchored major pilin [Eubacteriales bacterium]